MFLQLAVLAILAIVAESVPTQPSICKTFVTINEFPPKYLCFVKMDLTVFFASKMCAKNGMSLYDPTSSPEALSALVNLVKTALGGSKKAEVLISGKVGNRCKTFTGDGRTTFGSCKNAQYFVCEMPTPVIQDQCESYDSASLTYGRYVDTTGRSDGRSCVYKAAISDPYTVIVSDPSVITGDKILGIDMVGTPSVQYLPMKLAESFSRLNVIRAYQCGLTTISYENFKGLTQLKYLDLLGNQLTTLDAAVFRDLTGLLYLDFYNPVTSMSPTIFSVTLPLLDSLSLGGSGSCIGVFCSNRACVAGVPDSVPDSCTMIP